MTNKKTENPVQKRDDINHNPTDGQDTNAKNIERHKQAAAHHIEAAKHHEEGQHVKAAHNTVLAYGHAAIAGDFLKDDAKHHAQALKQTNYQ